MAQLEIDTTALPHLDDGRAAILTSKWYPQQVNNMADRCHDLLVNQGFVEVHRHTLPGALELPYACQQIAKQIPTLEAIICLAVVVRGETEHFNVIRDFTTQGFLRVSLDMDIPILNELLFVHSLDDAIARSSDDASNKGIEAAAAAIEVVQFTRSISKSS